MLLGFKKRFEEFVRTGSKTHTFRVRGKRRRFRVGDICDCYGDTRQKTMHLLGRWPCVRVDTAAIFANPNSLLRIRINGQLLDASETVLMAYRDGFRENGFTGACELMRDFWIAAHGIGWTQADLIHWDYAKPCQR